MIASASLAVQLDAGAVLCCSNAMHPFNAGLSEGLCKPTEHH